jgi:hypothetical protein
MNILLEKEVQMPNIEIIGFEQNEIEELTSQIQNAFRGKDYEVEYVITVFPGSYVIDVRGARQPYIRLVSTPNDYNAEILDILQKITVGTEHVDVEYMLLQGFYMKF